MVPALGFRYPSVLYAVLVISLFIILVYKNGIKSLFAIIPIFFIPILDVFFKVNNFSFLVLFQQISGVIQRLILPLLSIYIIKYNYNKLGGRVLGTYLAIMVITCITSYVGYDIFPNASRELAFHDGIDSDLLYMYLNANIGGFSFIYNLTLLNILVIYSIKNPISGNKGIWLICSISFLILMGMVVYNSQYTTAIIIYFVSLLLLLFNQKFKIRHIIILFFIGFMIFLLSKDSISEMLENISTIVESSDVSLRLYDLSQYIIGEHTSTNSDLDARSLLYGMSIDTFLRNPLGTWSNIGDGGHSFILDSIARYGFLGVIMITVMIYRLYVSYVKKLRNSPMYGYAFIILIVFILLATINPHIFTDIIMFVLPLYSHLINNRSIHESGKSNI